jgi:cold shock CspA family protein
MLHGLFSLFYAFLFESKTSLLIRNDNGQDIYAHFTSVAKKNPSHRLRSLGDGELVRFNIVDTAKGLEAIEITGPDGEPVIGSEYAIPSNRRREPPITESPRGRVPRNGRAESRRAPPPPQQNYDDQQIQSPRRRRPIPRRSESGGGRLNDDGMRRPINRRRGPPMNPRNNYAPNPYNNNNFYNNDEPLYYTFKPSNFNVCFFLP